MTRREHKKPFYNLEYAEVLKKEDTRPAIRVVHQHIDYGVGIIKSCTRFNDGAGPIEVFFDDCIRELDIQSQNGQYNFLKYDERLFTKKDIVKHKLSKNERSIKVQGHLIKIGQGNRIGGHSVQNRTSRAKCSLSNK